MTLFTFPGYENIAKQLQATPFVQAGRFTVGRFANQELYARIDDNVHGEHCLVLGTIAPPDESLLLFLLLGETRKHVGDCDEMRNLRLTAIKA